ncbi:unnamed protein product [Ixodes persulcatus]
MTVVAGWILHCELHKGTDAAMTHLAFRRDVAMSLLHPKQKLALRPGPRVHPSIAERKTDGHYIVSATQGRCAECKKKKNTQKTHYLQMPPVRKAAAQELLCSLPRLVIVKR